MAGEIVVEEDVGVEATPEETFELGYLVGLEAAGIAVDLDGELLASALRAFNYKNASPNAGRPHCAERESTRERVAPWGLSMAVRGWGELSSR